VTARGLCHKRFGGGSGPNRPLQFDFTLSNQFSHAAGRCRVVFFWCENWSRSRWHLPSIWLTRLPAMIWRWKIAGSERRRNWRSYLGPEYHENNLRKTVQAVAETFPPRGRCREQLSRTSSRSVPTPRKLPLRPRWFECRSRSARICRPSPPAPKKWAPASRKSPKRQRSRQDRHLRSPSRLRARPRPCPNWAKSSNEIARS